MPRSFLDVSAIGKDSLIDLASVSETDRRKKVKKLSTTNLKKVSVEDVRKITEMTLT